MRRRSIAYRSSDPLETATFACSHRPWTCRQHLGTAASLNQVRTRKLRSVCHLEARIADPANRNRDRVRPRLRSQ